MRNPRAFRMENHIRTRYAQQDYLVLTSKLEKVITKGEQNIYRLGFKRHHQNSLRQHLKKFAVFRILNRFFWPDDKIFFNIWSCIYYILFLRKNNDHIYTVSHPFSAHLIGYFLKKFYKHTWTADIGDLYWLPNHKAQPFQKWNQKLEQSVLSYCDSILVNADSIRDYFSNRYQIDQNKFQVLPNGNRLDFSKLKRPLSEIPQLTFIGNTYAEIRDGLSEIEVFLRLHREYPELKLNIQLLGNLYPPLLHKIAAHRNWIQHGLCESDEALLKAYSETDILLNFANKNYPGLPSKLEEYTSSGIPIIHFCWQHNDPSSLYLQERKYPFLEYVFNESTPEVLKTFIQNTLLYGNVEQVSLNV